MNESRRDDHQARPESGETTPDHFKSVSTAMRNGVPILPSRGETVTPAHVQEILDEVGI